MPNLQYLDDSPCFPKDRQLAEAFVKGGLSAERAMREKIRVEEDAKRSKSLEEFNEMVKRAKDNAAINPPPPRDPMRFVAQSKGTDSIVLVQEWFVLLNLFQNLVSPFPTPLWLNYYLFVTF